MTTDKIQKLSEEYVGAEKKLKYALDELAKGKEGNCACEEGDVITFACEADEPFLLEQRCLNCGLNFVED